MDNDKTNNFKNNKENRVIYKTFLFIDKLSFFLSKGKNINKLYKIII